MAGSSGAVAGPRPVVAAPLGKVLRAEGIYLFVGAGSRQGVTRGKQVAIVRNGKRLTLGTVLDVRPDNCDVELEPGSAGQTVRVGDLVIPLR